MKSLLQLFLMLAICTFLPNQIFSQTSVTIGTGTTNSTTFGPIYGSSSTSSFKYSNQAYLYTEAELATAGILPGATITSLAWNKTGTGTNTSNFKIYLKTTTATGVTGGVNAWGLLQAGSTLLYDNPTLALTAATGYQTFALTSSFAYNGGSLVVFTDAFWSANSAALNWQNGALTGSNRTLYYNASTAHAGTSSSTGSLSRPNMQVVFTPAPPCSGTPAPGSTTSSASALCSGGTTTLGLQNSTGGSGVTYQWESSADNMTFSAVSGATGSSYTTPAVTGSTYYRCVVNCGGNMGTSTALAVQPTAYGPTYSQNFASYPATSGSTIDCWSEAAGTLAAPTTFLSSTASGWTSDGFANVGSTGAAKLNIYGTTQNNDEWMFSPSILIGSSKQLEYDVALTGFGGATATTLGADDKAAVIISTDNGATWSNANTLQLWNSSTPISNVGQHMVHDLSAYAGMTVRIGFYGESTVVNADNDFFIDNFAINDIPACTPPTAIASANVTGTSADISWTCAGCTGTYVLEYGLTGFTPGAGASAGVGGTVVATSGTSSSVSGLTAATGYTFYVRRDCGAAVFSPNISTVITTTLDCSTAISLACSTPVTATTVAGNGAYSNNACGFATPGKEVLFTFTATATGTHILNVTAATGGYIDYMFKDAAGGCGSTGWTCIEDLNAVASINFGPLTAGTTYFIMGDPELTTSMTHTFQIVCPAPPACVASPTAPANGGNGCAGGTTTLTWPSVAGATSYDVYFGNATAPALAANVTTASYAAATAATGTYYWKVVPKNTYGDATGCAEWTFTANPAPAGNTQATAIPVATTSSTAGNNLTSNCWTSTYTGANAAASPDVFYTFTAGACDDSLTISVCGASFDTYLHLLDNAGTEVKFADDNGPLCSGTTSSMTYLPTAGATYYVVVEGWSSSTGTYTLAINSYDTTDPVADAASLDVSMCATSYSATAPTATDECDGALTGATADATAFSAAGLYTINWTYTDADGNTATQVQMVDLKEPATVSISSDDMDNTACFGVAVALTASGSDAYAWSTTETTAAISVTTAGTYSVVATSANGCTAEANIAIAYHAETVATIASDDADNVICFGDDITITAAGGDTYLWNTGAMTSEITVTETGDYTVVVTDANGCTDDNSVTITNDSPVGSDGTTSACSSVAMTYDMQGLIAGGVPSDFSWLASSVPTTVTGASTTAQSGNILSDVLVNSAAVPQTVIYSVVPISQGIGCGGVPFTVTVTVSPLPIANVVTNGALNICAGKSRTLNASATSGAAPYTFNWSIGDVTGTANGTVGATGAAVTFVGTGAGTVDVIMIAVDANGCPAANIRKVFTVMAAPAPAIAGATTACGATMGTYSTPMVAGNTYLWTLSSGGSISGGNTGASVNINWATSSNGNHTVKVKETNADGCVTETTMVVAVSPRPTVAALPTIGAFCPGSTVAAVAISSTPNNPATVLSWAYTGPSVGGVNGSSTGATGSVPSFVTAYTGTTVATNTLTVTATLNGCTNAKNKTFTVRPSPDLSTVTTPTICAGASYDLNNVVVVDANNLPIGATTWHSGYPTNAGNALASFLVAPTATTVYYYSRKTNTTPSCEDVLPVTVTVNPLPVPAITASAPEMNCANSVITLTAHDGATYAWSTTESTDAIMVGPFVSATYPVTNTFTVTVTSAFGCSSTEMVSVTATENVSDTDGDTVCDEIDNCVSMANTDQANNDGDAEGDVCDADDDNDLSLDVDDCLPMDATAYPGNNEWCGDMIDNDCDGATDEEIVVSIAATADSISCTSVELTGTGAGDFLWSNDSTSTSITVTAAGTYELVVGDAYGCLGYAEYEIIGAPAIAITVESTTDNVCFGLSAGAIDVTTTCGFAPYTWSWTGPDGYTAATEDITGLAAGGYVVEITDSEGLTLLSDSIYIVQPDLLVAEMDTTNVGCDGLGSMTVVPAGGTMPYTYLWASGETTSTQMIATAALYSVVVTDANGCTADASYATAVTNVFATVDPLTFELSCVQTAVIINSTGLGDALWSNSATAANIFVSLAGNYTVTYTAPDGCTASATAVITGNPSVGDPDGDLVCDPNDNCPTNANADQADFDGDLMGDACDTDDDNDGWPEINVDPLLNDCAPLDSTIYPYRPEICGDMADNDCDGFTDEPILITTITVTKVSCFGGSDGAVDIETACGIAPYTYAWSNGSTTQDISTLVAGTYSLTVTDFLGLTRTRVYLINEPALLTVTTTNTDLKCRDVATGKMVANPVGGNGGYTYLWSNGATSKTASALLSGPYTVTVTDSKGCSATATGVLNQPTTAVNASLSGVALQSNGMYTLSISATGGTAYGTAPAHRFRVCPNGINCTTYGSASSFMDLPAGQTHVMIARDFNACADTVTFNIPALGKSGANEMVSEGQVEERNEMTIEAFDFEMYPNPTAGEMTMVTLVDEVFQAGDIILTDAYGRQVVRAEISAPNGGLVNWVIPTEKLAAGVYQVTVRLDNARIAAKKLLVVEK